MPEYTQAIDLHIARTLSLRGFVTGEMLPGLDAHDALEMLRLYAEAHSDTQRLHFDGSTLKSLTVPESTVAELPSRSARSGLQWWVFAAVVAVAVVAIAFVSFGKAGVRRSASWPASPDGHIAFYYFGTST